METDASYYATGIKPTISIMLIMNLGRLLNIGYEKNYTSVQWLDIRDG